MINHSDATEFIGGALGGLAMILPQSLLAKYVVLTIASAVYEWVLDMNPLGRATDFTYRQVAITAVFMLAYALKLIFAL